MAGAIVAVARGGSSRSNGPSPWEAPRRPFSLYNFNSRVDDFVLSAIAKSVRLLALLFFSFSFPSLPPPSHFFFLFLSLLQSEHRCSQTTAAQGHLVVLSRSNRKNHARFLRLLVATQSSRVSHPAGSLTKCQRILRTNVPLYTATEAPFYRLRSC